MNEHCGVQAWEQHHVDTTLVTAENQVDQGRLKAGHGDGGQSDYNSPGEKQEA